MTQARQNAIGGVLSLVLGLVLGLVLLLSLIPIWVEPDADLRLPVSLVPQVVAIGLVLCGIALLFQVMVSTGERSAALENGFEEGEFRWFVVMILILLAATVGFQLLHFLVVAPALVAVTMWIYGPVRPASLVLTSVLGPTVIWILGTQVLGRVLP